MVYPHVPCEMATTGGEQLTTFRHSRILKFGAGKVCVYETGVFGLEFGRSCPGFHRTWTNEGLGIGPWRGSSHGIGIGVPSWGPDKFHQLARG